MDSADIPNLPSREQRFLVRSGGQAEPVVSLARHVMSDAQTVTRRGRRAA